MQSRAQSANPRNFFRQKKGFGEILFFRGLLIFFRYYEVDPLSPPEGEAAQGEGSTKYWSPQEQLHVSLKVFNRTDIYEKNPFQEL
jgi:hypothetical protein